MPDNLISRADAKAAIRESFNSPVPMSPATHRHLALAALDAVPAAGGRWEKLRASVNAAAESWKTSSSRDAIYYGDAYRRVLELMARLSPPASEKAEGARQYDEHGQPVCSHCGKKTNRAYAKHEKLQCWSCGLYMPDLTSRTDAAQRERE